MVNPWWLLSAPAAVVGGATVFRRGGGGSGGDVKARRVAAGEGEFVCERVCASNKLLNKLGGLAKDPTPGACVTVCGVSDVDACTEACAMAVCNNSHQVPKWNEECSSRCVAECMRASGRA
uniref:Uncharacterized protein n=1 Tax=Prasinoderma coloniale TaxID=156133 RepID=A0A7R9U0X7_9VIRI|eukprot:PRCOL_00001176-RA